jgi:hypothetical protein
MKVTSKQWLIVLAAVVACSSRRDVDAVDAIVDVWTSRANYTAHLRSPGADGVCAQGGSDRAGLELRLDGGADDAVRRVDIEIPRSSGTEAFYAGVTTISEGRIDQWSVETREGAARQRGEGHAWTHMTPLRITTLLVARVDSSWYTIRVECATTRRS